MAEKPQGPPYRGGNGIWLTKSLFVEASKNIPKGRTLYDPVFTLYGQKDGYISCSETFVEERDPTGYKWAMKYLGDYEHFRKLMSLSYFKEAYDSWIEELNELIRSEAIQQIQLIMSEGPDAQKLQAAKYLAGKEWEGKKATRGRPSKEEVSGNLKKAIEASENELEDMKRMGLEIIQGGKK